MFLLQTFQFVKNENFWTEILIRNYYALEFITEANAVSKNHLLI